MPDVGTHTHTHTRSEASLFLQSKFGFREQALSEVQHAFESRRPSRRSHVSGGPL